MSRLTVVITSPRLPAGLLSRSGWRLLESAAVFGSADSPLVEALTETGIPVTVLDSTDPSSARTLLDAADSGGDAAWVAGPDGDEELLRRIGELLTAGGDGSAVELEVLPASWDPPGARLLDVVAVVDRLRSPGGCPWDADQTHASLAPYLIEEAYEALETLESGDIEAMREEFGDVLVQVVLHARLGAEDDPAWTIDDVAAELVDKLIRRHPHVFADAVAATAEDVNERWETIKATERGESSKSPLSGVPLGQPALRLATAVQRKSVRLGDEAASAVAADPELAAAAAAVSDADSAARLLWAVVARCRELGIDPEDALRGLARHVRGVVESATAGLTDGSSARR